jgi:MFS family permease
MGIGSGLGFFVGPQYAGWRANVVMQAHGPARAWQTPCVEMGVAGLVFALLYLILAREAPHAERKAGGALPPAMRWRVLGMASVLGMRDFSGVATTSLVGLYLMKAWGYNSQQAGLVVGAMMLISMVANPLAVVISNGPRRLVMLASVLVIGGAMLAFVPQVPVKALLGYLAVFQVFHLGSYAVGEASILERVSPQVRGRVIGLFLTLAGTAASTSPWIMGFWVDALGERARTPAAYMIPFAVLGGMMAVAAGAAVIINGLGEPEPAADVAQAVDPSMEPI